MFLIHLQLIQPFILPQSFDAQIPHCAFKIVSPISRNHNSLRLKKITPKKEIKPKSYQLKGSGSLFIDGYVRIDYYSDNNIAIYLSNALNVTHSSLKNPKLKSTNKKSFNLEKNKDIVIEDLCFIKFAKPCQIVIYTPYQVNIYERDNLI